MRETDLRDLLPAERALPPARRREMQEALMAKIEKADRVSARRFGVVAVTAAAALLLTVAGAVRYLGQPASEETSAADGDGTQPASEETSAADGDGTQPATPRSRPIPAEVAIVLADATEEAAVHLPGWRPELAVERITCVTPAEPMSTWASEFPLEDLITLDSYLQECTAGTDAEYFPANEGHPEYFDPALAEVCVAVGDGLVVPRVVVGLGGLGCAELQGDSAQPLHPLSDQDLVELNRWRGIEVALRANPDPCLDRDSASEWVEDLLAAENVEIPVEVAPAASESGCWQVRISRNPDDVVVVERAAP